MKSFLKNIASLNKVITILLISIFIQGCSLNKFIPEDKYLLKKAVIKDAPEDYKGELQKLLKQSPSRKMFGFTEPFYWIHYKLIDGKDTNKFQKVLNKNLGEEPIYLDSLLVYETILNMNNLLLNKGYFNSSIDYKVDTKPKLRKAKIKYYIIYNEPYTIRNVEYFIPDKHLNKLVTSNLSNSNIQAGQIYNSSNLITERSRIAEMFNDNGYYKFGKNYISYEVDTALNENNKVDVRVYLKNFNDSTSHKKYFIRNVYIDPHYQIADTVQKFEQIIDGYHFLSSKPFVKPELILKYIKIRPNRIYIKNRINLTINQLSEINTYKFIDINFKESKEVSDTMYLDCYIRLTPLPKYGFDFNAEAATTEENKNVTTSDISRYYGMAGDVSVERRNVLKRAILWTINAGGAFDVPLFQVENSDLFANYQLDVNTSLLFPGSFVIKSPILNNFLSKKDYKSLSKTATNLSYFYESNQDYKRFTTNFSYTYQKTLNLYTKHFFNFIDFSLVNNELNPAFQAQLDSLRDILLTSTFETHLLSSLKYSRIYNSKGKHQSYYWRVRGGVEFAGFLPYFFNDKIINSFSANAQEPPYQLFNTNFFQFIKTDLDAAYNFNINQWSSIATHGVIGIGLPLKNSTVLPFEKLYFSGGANSIRAWTLRGLGPGSYKNESNEIYRQTGDIKLEYSLEYRFDMVSFLEGALFIDAGNIWNFHENDLSPGGLFEVKDFLSEVAIGSGVGLRFDFVFFVFRTDFAIPIHDPAQDLGNRWVLTDTKFKDIKLNIGIGYPF